MTGTWHNLGLPRPRPGWTLLECVMVVALMGMIFALAAPVLHSAAAAYRASQPRVLAVQEGRFVLAHAARALCGARAVLAAVDAGAGTAYLEFLAADGTVTVLQRTDAAGDTVEFGPAGSPATLARHCSALAVRCYAADGTPLASPLTEAGAAAEVEVAVDVADPEGTLAPTTLVTRVRLARPRPTIVLNEIMYDPTDGPASTHQWVELYNPTHEDVDVAGWQLWTKDKDEIDTLYADVAHGGSSIVPAGGYGVVTDTDSGLYAEAVTNGSFEDGMSGWSRDFGSYDLTSDAPVGDKKIEIYYHTWAKLWQTFDVPAGGAVTFSFWEMEAPGQWGGRILVRLRDLDTGITHVPYDGPTSEQWTLHTFDVSYLAGHQVKIELKYCAYNGFLPRSYFDGISLVVSPFPADCARLVTDNDIGKDLADEHLFIGRGRRVEDAMAFKKSWGGDGDGTTLSRVSPWAPGAEQASWTSGPYGGTPGEANP